MYKKYPKGLTLSPEKEYLVRDNMNLALKLANKWYNGVVDRDDLIQQAYLVLVDCATKFDPDRGNKFTTYAYRCIDITLNNYVQSYNKTVSIPINKIYKIHYYLNLPDEEKEAYRIQARITQRDIEFYKTYEMVSINAQVTEDYDDVTNLYATDETGYEDVANEDVILSIVENLHKVIREPLKREVYTDVILNEFDAKTYRSIAKKHSIDLSSVYNIIEECQTLMHEHKSDFF